MKNESPSSKVFLDIVGELRLMIKREGIGVGDKLPSERVLAEKLQVGRSSVREALRSLELLGLIETRRGEGTFLADFKKHQLVEVLSTFIMQQPNSSQDVSKTRRIHEKAAIASICGDPDKQSLPVWESLSARLTEEGSLLREDVVREMLVAAGNRLSLKIWFLLKQYSQVPFGERTAGQENELIERLLANVRSGSKEPAMEAYSLWMQEIEGEYKC